MSLDFRDLEFQMWIKVPVSWRKLSQNLTSITAYVWILAGGAPFETCSSRAVCDRKSNPTGKDVALGVDSLGLVWCMVAVAWHSQSQVTVMPRSGGSEQIVVKCSMQLQRSANGRKRKTRSRFTTVDPALLPVKLLVLNTWDCSSGELLTSMSSIQSWSSISVIFKTPVRHVIVVDKLVKNGIAIWKRTIVVAMEMDSVCSPSSYYQEFITSLNPEHGSGSWTKQNDDLLPRSKSYTCKKHWIKGSQESYSSTNHQTVQKFHRSDYSYQRRWRLRLLAFALGPDRYLPKTSLNTSRLQSESQQKYDLRSTNVTLHLSSKISSGEGVTRFDNEHKI